MSVTVGKLWKQITTQENKLKINNEQPKFEFESWLAEKPYLFVSYAFLNAVNPIVVIYQRKERQSQEQLLQITPQQIQEIVLEQQIQNFFQTIFNIAPSANQLKKQTHIQSNCKSKQICYNQVKLLLKQLNQIWQQNTFNDKVGLILQLSGCKTEEQMLSCQQNQMSEEFNNFLSILGEKVQMNGFTGYNGGLDIKGRESEYSIYSKEGKYETMFHVCPMFKFVKDDPEQVVRKRHIGNDHIVIIYQDSEDCQFSSTSIRIKKAGQGYDISIIAKQYIETSELKFINHIEGDQQTVKEQFYQILKDCHKAVWKSGELQQKLERLHSLKIQDCIDNRLTE